MPFPDPRAKQFNQTVAALNRLGYRKRRQLLWRQRPHLPHFLYKFRTLVTSDSMSIDRMRDIVVRSRLWLSSPIDFNDPYDMAVKISVDGSATELRSRFEKILKDRGIKYVDRKREVQRLMAGRDAGFPQRSQKGFEEMATSTGVCSFAGDPRSILMWSHYGDHHEGVCFQFEIARDPETFLKARPVVYSEDYPTWNWVSSNSSSIASMILRKHQGWAYEKERRIVIPESARQYIEFRPPALSGIIIGCRTKSDVTEQLAVLLSERSSQGFPQPKIYRASKHNSKYRLIISRDSNFKVQ